jgi:hypothetical protein
MGMDTTRIEPGMRSIPFALTGAASTTRLEGRRVMILSSLLGIALLAISPCSFAQGGPPDTAEEHARLGARHYEAGDFAAAAREFERAYQLEALPPILFNLSDCYFRLGRYTQALELVDRFLRTPDLPAERVREAEELRRDIVAAQGATPVRVPSPAPALPAQPARPVTPSTPPVQPTPTPPPAPPVQPVRPAPAALTVSPTPASPGTAEDVDDGRASRLRTAGWALLGVGIAGLLTGVVTGGLALSDQGEFDDGIDNGMSRLELEDLADAMETKALIADISLGISVLSLIPAVVLLAVGYVRRQRSTNSQGEASLWMPHLTADADSPTFEW